MNQVQGASLGVRYRVLRRVTCALGAAALGFGIISCGSFGAPATTSEPFSLTVNNIDGPPVDVLVNGKIVVHVVCYAQDPNAVAPVLVPTGSLPPTPWTVTVTSRDATIGSWNEDGMHGPRTILIRAGGAAVEAAAGSNPGPMPGSTCDTQGHRRPLMTPETDKAGFLFTWSSAGAAYPTGDLRSRKDGDT